MADIVAEVENTLETTDVQQSKEILRECKPSENISINSSLEVEEVKPDVVITESPKKEKLEIIIPESPSAHTETVFEKLEINDKSSSNFVMVGDDKTKMRQSAHNNRSDIFALDAKIPSENTIFSVNGTPSGRINRRRDEYSEVFPVGCMGCREQVPGDAPVNVKEAPSRAVSEKLSNHQRNPLTGAGVDSTDEIKKGFNGRRKDGNPVLGLGYDTGTTAPPSSTRVPPGGYSKGLW